MPKRVVEIKPKHDLTHRQMARELRRVSRISARANFHPLASALNEMADVLVQYDAECKANAKRRGHALPLGKPKEQ